MPKKHQSKTKTMEPKKTPLALSEGKDKPTKFITDSLQSNLETIPARAKRITWWLVALGLVLLFTIALSIGVWRYTVAFEQSAGTKLATVIQQARSGINQDVFQDRQQFTILLLGLDQVRNRREGSLLTDTIMLITVKPNGSVHLLSIPRDLWIDELKTKINALYYYGEISDQATGPGLTTTVVHDITGIEIDEVMVIDLELVKKVINALGGIEVDVQRAFDDNLFPRDDVDISSDDLNILYETISFDTGLQMFDGETALKFIRSRNSDDIEEGTDLARSRRQQQVILSLIQNLQSGRLLLQPASLGKLYYIWHTDVATNLTDEKLISLGYRLARTGAQIIPIQLSIAEDDQPGILFHPPVSKHSQWVYEPTDPTWTELQNYLQSQLQ